VNAEGSSGTWSYAVVKKPTEVVSMLRHFAAASETALASG
jgi:hypothetical protein